MVDKDFVYFFSAFFANFDYLITQPLAQYDALAWNQVSTVLDYIPFFLNMVGVLVASLALFSLLRFSAFGNSLFSFYSKFIIFMNTFSFENRFQLD